MTEFRVTEWNMAQVLLEMVPETAPRMARAAANAYNIDPAQLNIPQPVAPDHPQQTHRDQLDQALSASVGGAIRADFGPYSVAGWMLLPILESALDADPLDQDLVRRCCEFLEAALGGEDFVAEGITMMVAENFGSEHSGKVLPYAGPLFCAALRSWNWIS